MSGSNCPDTPPTLTGLSQPLAASCAPSERPGGDRARVVAGVKGPISKSYLENPANTPLTLIDEYMTLM